MNSVRKSAVYRLSGGIVVEDFGDYSVIFFPEMDRFVTINKAAARILKVISGSFGKAAFSQGDLAEALKGAFVLSAAKASAEGRKILAQWIRSGIIEAP